MAVVIFGGLVSSTLLDMVVTPVVFFNLEKSALKYIERKTIGRMKYENTHFSILLGLQDLEGLEILGLRMKELMDQSKVAPHGGF